MKHWFLIFLTIVVVLSFAGCEKSNDPVVVPDDFSFSLTWGTYGISSYDSATGTLIKTTDATNPADFITAYRLTEEERAYVYGLIRGLDLASYPEEYDPENGLSDPSMTLILTAVCNGTETTVRAEGIAHSYQSKDPKGQAFLSVCKEISTLLQRTEEWKTLPPYEVLYD